MDFELKSQPQLIKEFFYTTKDFLDFVRSAKKRSLDILEKKIILQRKLWGFKKVANELTLNAQVPSENLAQAIFYAIPIYNDILNELASYRNPAFDIFWMDVYGLMNELTCVLATIRSKGNLWNYQGTSNLLVKILLGLPKYETAPDPEPPQERERLLTYIAKFNSITSTSAVYTNVIVVLTNIPLQELCNWTSAAFWHFKIQFDMYEKALPMFPTWLVNIDLNQITYNILYYHMTFDPVRVLTMNLQAKFGTNWDTAIETYDVLQKKSIQGIEQLVDQLQKNIERSYDIIMSVYKSGQLPTNANPNNTINMSNLMKLKKFYLYTKNYLILFERLFFHTENTGTAFYSEQITGFLENSHEYSKMLETTAGGKEQVLKSITKNEYIDILAQRIEILTLDAKHEHTLKTFVKETKELQWLIDAKYYDLFPDFYLKYYLAFITVSIEYAETFNTQEMLEKLLLLREELVYSPRDYIAASVLVAILDYYCTRNTSNLEQYLDEAQRKGISEGGQFHLEEKFMHYSNYLKNILQKPESYTDRTLPGDDYKSIITYSTEEMIPLDSMTWLIPAFKKTTHEGKEERIIYLPFNRAKDAII